MFNFMFEGPLGEILAPITDKGELFLRAATAGDQAKMDGLCNEFGAGLWQHKNSRGVNVLHAVCQGPNTQLVDACLNQHLSIMVPDADGNTALHHASRGGHLKMVQRIMELGADVLARNHAGQTPYDYGSDLAVRQFLLPLQLRAENERNVGTVDAALAPFISTPASYGHYAAGAPPPAAGPPPSAPPASAPPVHTAGAIAETTRLAEEAVRRTGVARPILADGFHTSHNDPALMRKYKHATHSPAQASATPPPPVASSAPPVASSASPSPPGSAAPPINSYSAFAAGHTPGVPMYVEYAMPGAAPPAAAAAAAAPPPPAVHTAAAAVASPPPVALHASAQAGKTVFYAVAPTGGMAEEPAGGAAAGAAAAGAQGSLSAQRAPQSFDSASDGGVTEVWSSSSAVM